MRAKCHWVIHPMNGSVDFGAELNEELPLLIRKLMAQRGISGQAMAERYLRPRLANLGDPFVMQGMREAVERLFLAADRGEYVCIYGDYDVDGVSAVTLLHEVLSAYDIEHAFFVPTRTREGYGLSHQGIENALNQCKRRPSLLITVDCGTSSVDEVDELSRMGVDVIILDHHEGGTHGRPRAVAIVNAKLEENSEFTYLCSAGVVFKLAHALMKSRRLANFDLRKYLDMVAVATIADIVPLVKENRLLTRVGLKFVGNENGNMGLRTLAEVSGLKLPATTSHVSFRLGPRLNAAGRMGSPQEALELLTTRDEQRAISLASCLEEHNRRRQMEEEHIRNEAMQMLAENPSLQEIPVIVLGSRSWHPGVVGIVASVLMRRYYKPTFIISFDERGNGKGSGRSVPGISLVDALHACADCIVAGGGHDMAAGLELREEQLDAFRDAFATYVRQHSEPQSLIPSLDIDAEVSFDEISVELMESYALLEPFGNANPQPLFLSRNVMPSCAPRRVAGNHLRFSLHQGNYEQEAVFFNAADVSLPDPPWDIVFNLERNFWKGRTFLSIILQDIRSSEP